MSCSICFDDISVATECILTCDHRFHTACLTTWIFQQAKENKRSSCPLCRSKGSWFKLLVVDPTTFAKRFSSDLLGDMKSAIATIMRDKYSNWCCCYVEFITDDDRTLNLELLSDALPTMYENNYLSIHDPVSQTKMLANAITRKRGLKFHSF